MALQTSSTVTAARDLRPFRDVLIRRGTVGQVLRTAGGVLSPRTYEVEFLLTANLRIKVAGLRLKDVVESTKK